MVEVGFAGAVLAAAAVEAAAVVEVVPVVAEADDLSDRRDSSAAAASEDSEGRPVGYHPNCRRQQVVEGQDLVEAGSESARPTEGQVDLLQERQVGTPVGEHLEAEVRRLGSAAHSSAGP